MKKILIVEDENNLLKLYKLEFKDSGFAVDGCQTSTAALEYLNRQRPDLIILDVKLPDNIGAELLMTIKEKWPDIPVVVYTAYSNVREDRNFWTADDFIIKSGDVSELLDRVKSLLADKNR